MSNTTRATIYGVISTLEKYDIDVAKRILFQMAQDMDRQYDTETQRLRRKADVFDQLDAYGCSSATVWLDAEADRTKLLDLIRQGVEAAKDARIVQANTFMIDAYLSKVKEQLPNL